MKNLTQYLNEELIMELSSELLSRASKKAREKGRNPQANKFAIAAGKALENELKGWKPGPDAKDCGKVVAAIKDLSETNPAMKALVKADPIVPSENAKTVTLKIPQLKNPKTRGSNWTSKFDPSPDEYDFVGFKDVKIPNAKYYIFKDEYHKALHIGTLSDINGLIATCYMDFEDFDASNIVASFDTIKEAVAYAQNSKKKFCDSSYFMYQVESGTITDEDCYWEGAGESILSIIMRIANVNGLPDEYYQNARK